MMGHDAIATFAKRETRRAPLLHHRRIASPDGVCTVTPVTST
jgi:hypothetical protein